MNSDLSEPEEPKQARAHPIFGDRRIQILLLLAVLGLALYCWKNKDVFSEASIDMKLTRGQVAAQSRDWAAKLGYIRPKPIESTTFSFDEDAKTFLEFELGASRANELMKSVIPIWYWRTRFCKEFEQEEFSVWISPAGRLVAFSHEIPNDRAMPSLSHDDALKKAQDFVVTIGGASLDGYKLIDDSPASQPHRQDFSFTWEDKKTDYRDGRMRTYVCISGDQVTTFNQFLYVPEQWRRKFDTMRSLNSLFQQSAEVIYMMLFTVAFFAVIWAIASRNARWAFAFKVGGLIALGVVLRFANGLPDVIDSYVPNTQFKAYLINQVSTTLLISLQTGIVATLFVLAAEAIYRLNHPRKLAVENYFSLRNLGSRQLIVGILVGMCACCISLGWVVSYYLIGQHFNYWCPMDVNQYQVLSNYAPAYSAVCIGVEAAGHEELLYRVVALSLAFWLVSHFCKLLKLSENRTVIFWLSNVLQAAAWGFMHSNYPQQPAYARGIELTCSGMMFGWILDNFGLLPCLVSHYLLDAFLTAQPLFESANAAIFVSGLLPLVPFPLLAIFGLARHKMRPLDETPLENASIETRKTAPVVVQHEEAEHFPYRPLKGTTRWALTIALLVSVSFGLLAEQVPKIGQDTRVNITRGKAEERGRECLLGHNIDPSGWKEVAYLESGFRNNELQYLFEKQGLQKTINFARLTQPGYVWKVRFFKPMEHTEYELELDGNGNEIDFAPTLPEDAQGARLVETEARKRAQSYVNRIHPEFLPDAYDSVAKTDRKSRTDYTFTYKVPQEKVADADSKLHISVLGDMVADFSQHWDIPDKWIFEREKQTPKDAALNVVRQIFQLIIFLALLYWGVGLVRVGYLPWRPAILAGLVMALVVIPDKLNDLPMCWQGFSARPPDGQYYAEYGLSLLTDYVSSLGQNAFLVALALMCLRLLAPKMRIASVLRAVFKPDDAAERLEQRLIWLDGVIAAYSFVAISFGVDQVLAWCYQYAPSAPESILGYVCTVANCWSPLLNVFCDSFSAGAQRLLSLPIYVGVYAKYFRKFPLFLGFFVIYALVLQSSERYWQSYVISCSGSLVTAVLLWIFVARVARNNPVAYFLMGYAAFAPRIMVMVLHGTPSYSVDTVEACLLLLLPIAYVFYLYFVAAERPPEPDASAEDLR